MKMPTRRGPVKGGLKSAIGGSQLFVTDLANGSFRRRALEKALDLYEGFHTNHRLRIVLADGERARPMLYRMSHPEARAVAPSSEAYLWAVAEVTGFGFEDLTPLLKAQHEAEKEIAG
jgi:hypothetical protein